MTEDALCPEDEGRNYFDECYSDITTEALYGDKKAIEIMIEHAEELNRGHLVWLVWFLAGKIKPEHGSRSKILRDIQIAYEFRTFDDDRGYAHAFKFIFSKLASGKSLDDIPAFQASSYEEKIASLSEKHGISESAIETAINNGKKADPDCKGMFVIYKQGDD
jgi:hypothetical protein